MATFAERLRFTGYFPLGWLLLSLYFCRHAQSVDDVVMLFLFVPLAAVLGTWNALVHDSGPTILLDPRAATVAGWAVVLLLLYVGWRRRETIYGKLLAVLAGVCSGLVGFIGAVGMVD